MALTGQSIKRCQKPSSDIHRIWGTAKGIMSYVRYSKRESRKIPFEEHITKLMARKSEDRVAGN